MRIYLKYVNKFPAVPKVTQVALWQVYIKRCKNILTNFIKYDMIISIKKVRLSEWPLQSPSSTAPPEGAEERGVTVWVSLVIRLFLKLR